MSITQGSMFGSDGYGGYSRATDPQTSRDAGREHAASGTMGENCRIVLRTLKVMGDATYKELFAFLSEIDQHKLGDNKEVARRLADLAKARLVRVKTVDGEQVTRVPVGVKGKAARVWEAV